MREIYYNGVIYTGTGRDAEAMAVEDGRIAAVGKLTDLETCSDAVYHNLDGHFVIPGFNDSHMHLLNYGHTLKLVDLTWKRCAPHFPILFQWISLHRVHG